MSEPAITLAISEGAFVVFNGSRSSFKALNRGVYLTRIFLRKPNPNFIPGTSETVKFDATAYDGLRVGFWQDNPGTDSNILTLTDQTGWAYNTDDPDNPYFEGEISTRTSEISTWMDTACHKECFLAIGLVKGTEVVPFLKNTCDENFTIYAQVDPGSGSGFVATAEIPVLNLPIRLRQGGVEYLAQIIPGTPNVLDISEI